MFTGIIEEIGIVQGIKKGEKSSKLLIKANKVLEKTRLGDSISTNGVCLTVTNINGNIFEADIMAETLRRSNLGNCSIGSKVNLWNPSSACMVRFGAELGVPTPVFRFFLPAALLPQERGARQEAA